MLNQQSIVKPWFAKITTLCIKGIVSPRHLDNWTELNDVNQERSDVPDPTQPHAAVELLHSTVKLSVNTPMRPIDIHYL